VELRLWPLPGSSVNEPRSFELPDANVVTSIAFASNNRFLFAVGTTGRAWIVPLDGSAVRRLTGFSEDTLLRANAVSPSGRQVAAASFYGEGEKILQVWNLETGDARRFELPASTATGEARTGYEQGIFSMAFVDESTLYTAGDGGLRRWDLKAGSQEVVTAAAPGYLLHGSFSADTRIALTAERLLNQVEDCPRVLFHDLKAGSSRPLLEFGQCGTWRRGAGALDPSGSVAASGTLDGIVRVGRLSSGERHLLLGHQGVIDSIAISPDLRWIATSGEDNTLRLWPMPDLSKPSLHTLPHAELLARLRALTNIRALPDAASPGAYKLEPGPFPGWARLVEW
jgi:WD40 repeat protein